MNPTRRYALGVLSASLFLGPAIAAEPFSIVATTGMIADAAKRVGGDLADVKALMGPGIDPHAYRQTRTDIVAMTRADLVLAHGLYLEAQMTGFLEDLGRKTPVVAVADGLQTALLRPSGDYEDRFDPHVWMNPGLWAHVVDAITNALVQTRPEARATFMANADRYKAELAQLDQYMLDVLAKVPEPARVLLTAHDAFGYFGQAYGFEVLGIQGISTESEAGLARISELVDVLVARDIKAVFVETSVSDRNIRALIEGAEAKGHRVRLGGALFSDAMGPQGSYEGTYIGMMDHNATTIARALGADISSGGMSGRLAIGG